MLDAATDQAIAAASVMLLSEEGEVVRSTLTDSVGAFTLEAPYSGRYQLHARRIGYEEVTSPAFDLVPNEILAVELRIGVEAIALAPLTVTSDRQALVMDERLKRWGYYERRAMYGEKMGFATFLDYEDLERKIAFRGSDVVRGVPGLRIQYTGGREIEIVNRSGCIPTFYLDGNRLPRGEPIDLFVEPSTLVAVEIYSGMVQSGRYPGSCGGAVVFWTGLPPEGE